MRQHTERQSKRIHAPSQVPLAQVQITLMLRLDTCTQVPSDLWWPHRERGVELVPSEVTTRTAAHVQRTYITSEQLVAGDPHAVCGRDDPDAHEDAEDGRDARV